MNVKEFFKKNFKLIISFILGISSTVVSILLFSKRDRPSTREVGEGISDTKESVKSMGETIHRLTETSSDIEHSVADIRDTVDGLTETSSDIERTKNEYRESTDRFGDILSEIKKRKIEGRD